MKHKQPLLDAEHMVSGLDIGTIQVKPAQKILVPRFNKLYDTLRTNESLRYYHDASATGNITPVASVLTQGAALTFVEQKQFQLRTSQWPGGVQAYLAIRFFTIAPETVPAVTGNIQVYYVDPGGYRIPIGTFPSQSGGGTNIQVILPTPLTDPNPQNIGAIAIKLNPGGASAVVYDFDIGYTFLYLLPAPYAYDIIDLGEERHDGTQK